jgi:uncharacterized membrane protein
MKQFKWSLILLVINVIVMMYFALELPADARIPMHWNAQGEIDGWTSKLGAVAFHTGGAALLFLLMYLMPYYSPWYKKYEERMERVVPSITNILILFFTVIGGYAMLLAKNPDATDNPNMVLILIGFLFILLGNILPKVPKNFFIGIKTPWTLANDEVWLKTHRLGGGLFVISGFIMILKGLILTENQDFQTLTTVVAMAIVLYPLLHSFILFRRIKD